MKYFEKKLSQKLRERPHGSQLKFGTSAKISSYLKYFSFFLHLNAAIFLAYWGNKTTRERF